MFHSWSRLFFNIQQLSFVNRHWHHFVPCYIHHKAWSDKYMSLWLQNCSHKGTVTMFQAHLGRSMTSLKILSVGTNVYVCVCHVKISARWQHDKMVSIFAAKLEDKCLKIIVACQEFKMGYFPRTRSFMSSLKNRQVLSLIFSIWDKKQISLTF